MNQELQHLWLEETGKSWSNRRVLNVKTRKRQKKAEVLFEISYWQDNETSDESEDLDIPWSHFLVDLILGDLCLL